MNPGFRLFLFLLILCASTQTFAQQTKNDLITADFNKASFEQFAKKIEAQTSYHFYFDPAQLDSFEITISVAKVHLSSLLNQVFHNTDLNYTIEKGLVFITRGFILPNESATGFFNRRRDSIDIAQGKASDYSDYIRPAKKVVQEISIENKLFEIGLKVNTLPKGNVNLAGYIRDGLTGEAITGATIYVEKPHIQVASDQFGYYSIILPAGRHTFTVIAPGMFDARRQLMLYSDGKFSVEMDQKVLKLKEVRVELGKEKNVRSTMMGTNKLDIVSMKQIPTAFGEVDVLRAVLSLPGVKSVGEASTGLNVRGGATDQNLILFNGANIYNPSHLFGFFSAFDPDVIKDVTLYKSSIPPNFGGRISSVLDITSLDGNDKKISGSAGVGPLTGKVTLEGPIIKDKTTFVAGVRTTYSNWLFKLLPSEYEKSKASFEDATIHISHKVDNKNNIYLNGYISGDKFNLNSDTTYQYYNKNANVKWKHNFNNRFYSVLSAGIDHYDYKVSSDDNPVNAYQLAYKINQYKANLDFSYFLNNKHKLSFGLSTLKYNISSGTYDPFGKQSLVIADTIESEHALESAAYISDQFNITPDLSLEGGVRYSLFNYLGPKNVAEYAPGLPRRESNLVGTNFYPAGKIINTYSAPEYRISGRYSLSENTSIKASFNTLQQYIHMLSNTTAISPTDIWKLSDPNIRPQEGTQVSLGFYKNFKSNTIETSVEVYYKWIKNYLDYKSGAVLIMNHHIETDVFSTKGKSYGVELLAKKATGKLNGWASYTYSRSLIRQNDPLAGELVNGGNYYPSNFDQPHNATMIGNYRITHRYSVSLNVIYSTGRPITLPVGVYDYAGSARLLYSDRNEYRIPDYFRTDFSVNIDGNHKVKQLTHNSWTVGVYNFTAQKNAYSVYFISQNGTIKAYKLSIFGTAIPFITYNIRF
ncbi:MAG TPA: carboxypeptidase-like regulatory domain-containing protein [Hanamia sp.]|nr:carboxypeptidase-like regulatory domain-containing protein [Hanamia sp.]